MRRTIVAAGILAIGLTGPLQAQVVVDQNQPLVYGGFGGLNYWSSQTFQTTAGNVAGGGFFLTGFTSGTANVTIQLWDMTASLPGAAMLASGTTAATFSSDVSQWVDIFWSAVAVAPGSTPYLNVISDVSYSYTNWASGLPLWGEAGYNFDTNPTAPNGCCWSSYDLTFRTYTDLQGPGSVTPEPVTMVLVGSGLAGIAAARRRRKQA